MKKEAEIHAQEDSKKKEEIEIKNSAESLIYMSEKAIKDAGDKIKPENKKLIEEKIELLKKTKDNNDIEAIKKASQELSTEIQKIGEAMYNPPAAENSNDQNPKSETNPNDQNQNTKPEEEKK